MYTKYKKMIWILIVAVSIIVLFIYGSFMSVKWQKEHRGKSTIEMDKYYYWKMFYSNSDDQRVFVPKKSGGGYTLNFGNPISIITGVVVIGGFLYGAIVHF